MSKRLSDLITRLLAAPKHPTPAPEADPPPTPEVAAVAVEPKGPDAAELAGLGDRARDRRDWAEAATRYEQALLVQPAWPAIRVQYGNMLKECGRIFDAEAAYRRALAEEPDNADTHLQLGHVLKLQSRFDDARDAYLACLTFEPTSQHARDELRSLGVPRRVIESHLAAAAIESGARPRNDTVAAASALLPIEHVPAATPRGAITEIGIAHVAGLVHDVGVHDLPLILVCRCAETVIATHVIEVPRDDEVASFPRDVRFRMPLPEVTEATVLHLRFEPNGGALLGSPFVPLGSGPAALIERLERLEAIVDGGLLPVDVEARLERRLTQTVIAAAGARMERLLGHQRRLFERQLLAVEARLVPDETPSVHRLCEPAVEPPRRVRFSAGDGLPGLGWSPVDVGSRGCRQAWMGRRALLSFPVAAATCHFARIGLGDVATGTALEALRVAAGGADLRHWIEPTPDGNALLLLAIPGRARRSDGRIDLVLSCDTPDVSGNTLAAVEIDVEAAPPSRDGALDIAAPAAWIIRGWRSEEATASIAMVAPRASIALPGASRPEDAELTLLGEELPADLVLALNGFDLAVTTADGRRITARLPAAIRNPGEPDILVLDRCGGGDLTQPPPRIIRLRVVEVSPLAEA